MSVHCLVTSRCSKHYPLSLSQKQGSTTPVPVLHTSPGELVGLMGVITGEANNCSAQASVASRVAIIGRDDFFHLVRAYPQVLINAACLVNRKLSRLLRLADFAIEWHGVGAGKALYKLVLTDFPHIHPKLLLIDSLPFQGKATVQTTSMW